MNNTQKSLIALIRNAVCGEAVEVKALTADEIRGICELAAEHDMLNVAGKALLELNIVSGGELTQQLLVEQYGGVLRYQQQKYALDRMYAAFDSAGICYIPLKGAVIREFYPEPELRTSSDIDVLVKYEDMEKASQCLEKYLGCRYFKRTEHDISFWTDNEVHIELHHSLVSDKFVFGKPLSDAWECAQSTEGYRFDFTNEFFVYYHYAHMAKHLLNGGFGIRFVLDLWLMMKNMSVDKPALDALLEKGGIAKMAQLVAELADVWFGDKQHTEGTAALEDYIFDSGIYGTLENNVVIAKRNRGGRIGNLLNRIFIPADALRSQYPKLDKYIWLYPWYFVVRFFRIIFKNRDKALTELKMNQSADDLKSQKINKLFDMLDIR